MYFFYFKIAKVGLRWNKRLSMYNMVFVAQLSWNANIVGCKNKTKSDMNVYVCQCLQHIGLGQNCPGCKYLNTLYFALARCHLGNWFQFWALKITRDIEKLQQVSPGVEDHVLGR